VLLPVLLRPQLMLMLWQTQQQQRMIGQQCELVQQPRAAPGQQGP
jgi:hypothetical protein